MLWRKELLVVYNETNLYFRNADKSNIMIGLLWSEKHWKLQKPPLVDWLKSDGRWILHFSARIENDNKWIGQWYWRNIFTKIIKTPKDSL